MLNRITVTLASDERAALVRMAERERRDARDQAAILIKEALEKAGLLQSIEPPKQKRNSASQQRGKTQ